MFYASPLQRLLGRRRYTVTTRNSDDILNLPLDELDALDRVTYSWWLCQWYGFAMQWREILTGRWRPVWTIDEPA